MGIDRLNDSVNLQVQGQRTNASKRLEISNKDISIFSDKKSTETEDFMKKLEDENNRIFAAMSGGKPDTGKLKIGEVEIELIDKENFAKNTQGKSVETEKPVEEPKGKKAEKEAPAKGTSRKKSTPITPEEIKKMDEKMAAARRKYVQESHKNYEDALKKYHEACATGIRSKIREACENLKKAADAYLSDEGNTIQDCEDMQLRIIQKYSNVPKEFICAELMNEWTGKYWHHLSAEELCKKLGMSEEDAKEYISLERQRKELCSKTDTGRVVADFSLHLR
jgi:hypothetical protein